MEATNRSPNRHGTVCRRNLVLQVRDQFKTIYILHLQFMNARARYCVCSCSYMFVSAPSASVNATTPLITCWFFLSFSVACFHFIRLVPVMKAKWKGLRDMFRVEIKRIPRNDAGDPLIQPHEFESKWTHYRSLLFLGTYIVTHSQNITF